MNESSGILALPLEILAIIVCQLDFQAATATVGVCRLLRSIVFTHSNPALIGRKSSLLAARIAIHRGIQDTVRVRFGFFLQHYLPIEADLTVGITSQTVYAASLFDLLPKEQIKLNRITVYAASLFDLLPKERIKLNRINIVDNVERCIGKQRVLDWKRHMALETFASRIGEHPFFRQSKKRLLERVAGTPVVWETSSVHDRLKQYIGLNDANTRYARSVITVVHSVGYIKRLAETDRRTDIRRKKLRDARQQFMAQL